MAKRQEQRKPEDTGGGVKEEILRDRARETRERKYCAQSMC